MNTKNDVEVIINGKQYTISGYESSDYLQRIATHINDKYAELKQDEGYNRLDAEMRTTLLAINLSDDYYKVQELIQNLQREKEDLEKEIFNMKHDMIAMKSRLEEQETKLGDLKKDKKRAEHEIIRLTTELKNAKEDNEALLNMQSRAGTILADSIGLAAVNAEKESREEAASVADTGSNAEENVQSSRVSSTEVIVPLSGISLAGGNIQPFETGASTLPVRPENQETTENVLLEVVAEEEGQFDGSESENDALTVGESVSDDVPENPNKGNQNVRKLSKKSRKKRKR